MQTDSPDYLKKKQFFARVLTIYGRKPVLEALQDTSLRAHKLHLADSNHNEGVLKEILALAKAQNTPIAHHSRDALARISKNRKQDQGVALDIECKGFDQARNLLNHLPETLELIALDGVTNPQNVGMIIRSVCASPATGLLLPNKGCAKLDSLVIKASAGTLFKAKIYRCDNLASTLSEFANNQCDIYGLAADAAHSISSFSPAKRNIYVMGNETSGLSSEVVKTCTSTLKIPMHNNVESLNVGVAASLIAFRPIFS